MWLLNRSQLKTFLAVLLFVLFSQQAFAAVTNCRPGASGQNSINLALNFSITSDTTSVSPGTSLATAESGIVSLICDFTGTNSAQNTIYFKNTMPENVKNMLLDSGVAVTQRMRIGGIETVTITNPTVPNMNLGSWSNGPNKGIGLLYIFDALKGSNALKPFDTGVFLLGHHIDYQGQNLGVPIYLSIKGDLTLLCPSPTVNVTASNGGSVGFGTVSPQQMSGGGAINKTFNLNLSVPESCQTGLNISVRFESNGNTILGNKYLDMGNGLQVLINNGINDIDYGAYYLIGSVMPLSPVDVPYTATLSQIPGSTIVSGPFTKTIKVILSY